MNKKFIKLEELTDSRELLQKQPPKITLILIYILILILIVTLIWSGYSKREIVVRAQGIIQPTGYNSIRPLVTGVINKVHVKEGDLVKKGDLLLEVNHKEIDKEIEQINNKITDLEEDLKLIDKYELSVKDGENHFSAENKELEYFHKYQNFKEQVLRMDNTIKQYEKDMDTSLELEKEYKENLKKVKEAQEKAKENIESPKKQQEEQQNNVPAQGSAILTPNIVDETLNIKQQIQAIQKQMDSIKVNINNTKSDREQYINKELEQIYQIKNEKQKQIKEQGVQKEKQELSKEYYTIKSPMDGYIHMIQPMNDSEAIQAGNEVIKILDSSGNNKHKLELYVPGQDIASIKKGQRLKLHTNSQSYMEYDLLDGKVESIEINSRFINNENSNEQNNSNSKNKGTANFYIVTATIVEGPDKKKKAPLKTGMQVEGRVVVDSKTYLQLVLEKLNLWLNN